MVRVTSLKGTLQPLKQFHLLLNRCTAVDTAKPGVAKADYATTQHVLAFVNRGDGLHIHNGSDRFNLVAGRTYQGFLGTTPRDQSPHCHLT